MSLSLAFSNFADFSDFEMDDLDLFDFHVPAEKELSSSFDSAVLAVHPLFQVSCSNSPSSPIAIASVITPRKTISKISDRKVQPKKAFKKGMSVKEALKSYGQKVNMSRRPPTNVIVAFPHFDKCDSLIYFPNTLIRHLNTIDMSSASKLMTSHVDKDCIIKFTFDGAIEMTSKVFLRAMELSNDIEPDRIMCVHSTKVVENQIRSSVYLKLTDSQELYKLMACVCKDPNLAKMCVPDRAKRFNLYARDFASNDDLQRQLMTHATSHDDILFYMKMDMILTFDNVTKKIVEMDHVYEVTSLHVVKNNTSHAE